jgi:hypothetical protein
MINNFKLASAVALCAALFLAAAAASASTRQGKTRGSFSTSCGWHCWGDDDLKDDLRGTNVWCKWNGDHVAVHIRLSNVNDHDVVATIKTSYWIRNYGRHGSSLHSLKTIDVDANSTIDWTGDAGKPNDVPTGAPIERCGPSLYAIRMT